jgi:hypothetical protein
MGGLALLSHSCWNGSATAEFLATTFGRINAAELTCASHPHRSPQIFSGRPSNSREVTSPSYQIFPQHLQHHGRYRSCNPTAHRKARLCPQVAGKAPKRSKCQYKSIFPCYIVQLCLTEENQRQETSREYAKVTDPVWRSVL